MTQSGRGIQQLFAELKRRHVFRVAAIYGAVAFGILQVVEPLGTALGLSRSFVSLVVGMLILGFPVALVLAWAFEVTPDGVRKTETAGPGELEAIAAQPASRRWGAGLLALAGVVLLFGGWWMGRRGGPDAELGLTVPAAQASEFQRIAVLPFEDLGGNAENDPFVSGLHVDIHGKLAGLSDLRVTSLISVRDYGAAEKTTDQIADELAVDYLLRGSVRRAGDNVRVNVQLTDVALGEDLWVDEFDREVTVENLFAIQSEIARNVAAELEAALTPEDIRRLDAGLSTDNLEAINAYHRARAVSFTSSDGAWVGESVDNLERAVALAPEFVEAWSLLAWRRALFSMISPEGARRSLAAVARTEELAPGSVEAIKARAWYTYYANRDFRRAYELMAEARRMSPSDRDILMGLAFLQHRRGEFEEGLQTMKEAVALDPQNPETLIYLSRLLERMARWDAAYRVAERALAIEPASGGAKRQMVMTELRRHGDPGRALALATDLGLEPGLELAWFALLDRDYDRAASILAELEEEVPGSPAQVSRMVEMLALNELVRIEQLRGGDPQPFRDSLAALLGSDTVPIDPMAKLEARSRLTVGRESAGWAIWEAAVRDARAWDDQVGIGSELWFAAWTAARFGRQEEAFELLDESIARPTDDSWSVVDLELDPVWGSMRDDPRFDDLIARQRAYETEQARLAEAKGPWLP